MAVLLVWLRWWGWRRGVWSRRGRVLVPRRLAASDALPKVTRRVLVEHRERQDKARVDAGECWAEHGLVLPTSVGTPIEPRSLNRHFHGIRTRAGFSGARLHDLRHTA